MFEIPKSQFPPSGIETSTSQGPTVLFVGGAMSFSDQIIRAFNAEFPNLNPVRVAGLPDLHLFSQIHSNIALVIFEQSFSEQLCSDFPLFRSACGEARIIIAYNQKAAAQSVFHAVGGSADNCPLGFLPMDRPLDAWLAIAHLLICGEDYFPPELMSVPEAQLCADAQQVADTLSISGNQPCTSDEALTARELEVLSSVAQGSQNKIIADDLDISEHTVKLHIHNIIRKLGVSNRTAASAWYHTMRTGSGGPAASHAHG